ncbi:unnamed protein product, partial [Gadus morhua 'NCC']
MLFDFSNPFIPLPLCLLVNLPACTSFPHQSLPLYPADEQLRRGELGGSPAAQLREYHPFLCRTAAEASPAVRRRRHGGERDCTPGAELPVCHRAIPAGLPPKLRPQSDSSDGVLPELNCRRNFPAGRLLRRVYSGSSTASSPRWSCRTVAETYPLRTCQLRRQSGSSSAESSAASPAAQLP